MVNVINKIHHNLISSMIQNYIQSTNKTISLKQTSDCIDYFQIYLTYNLDITRPLNVSANEISTKNRRF